MAACFHQRIFFEASSTFQTIPLCQVHAHYHISRRNHDTVSHITCGISQQKSLEFTLPSARPYASSGGLTRHPRRCGLFVTDVMFLIHQLEREVPASCRPGKIDENRMARQRGSQNLQQAPWFRAELGGKTCKKNTKTHRNPLKSNVQWLNPWRLA